MAKRGRPAKVKVEEVVKEKARFVSDEAAEGLTGKQLKKLKGEAGIRKHVAEAPELGSYIGQPEE